MLGARHGHVSTNVDFSGTAGHAFRVLFPFFGEHRCRRDTAALVNGAFSAHPYLSSSTSSIQIGSRVRAQSDS
jgi:hypothetical protein